MWILQTVCGKGNSTVQPVFR